MRRSPVSRLAGGSSIICPATFHTRLRHPGNRTRHSIGARNRASTLRPGSMQPLRPGVELIVDGSVRRKFQQSQFFNYLDPNTFLYNINAVSPMNYVDTVMTTSSVTPRLDVSHHLFGVPNRLLTGIDFYNTQYNSDRRRRRLDGAGSHATISSRRRLGFYAMNTTAVRPDTDVSIGARIQRNVVNARDAYSPINDPNAGFYANNPQTPPFDQGEWQWAAHIRHRASLQFGLRGLWPCRPRISTGQCGRTRWSRQPLYVHGSNLRSKNANVL